MNSWAMLAHVRMAPFALDLWGGAYDELYVDITGVPELWDRLEPLRYTST
jgi:hypothetical protein